MRIRFGRQGQSTTCRRCLGRRWFWSMIQISNRIGIVIIIVVVVIAMIVCHCCSSSLLLCWSQNVASTLSSSLLVPRVGSSNTRPLAYLLVPLVPDDNNPHTINDNKNQREGNHQRYKYTFNDKTLPTRAVFLFSIATPTKNLVTPLTPKSMQDSPCAPIIPPNPTEEWGGDASPTSSYWTVHAIMAMHLFCTTTNYFYF